MNSPCTPKNKNKRFTSNGPIRVRKCASITKIKKVKSRFRSKHYKNCSFEINNYLLEKFCCSERCELCNSVTDLRESRWDHDHDVEGTGRCPYRARLCNRCNLREGQIRAKVLKFFGLDPKKVHDNWTLVQRKMYFNQMLEKLPITKQSLMEFLGSY